VPQVPRANQPQVSLAGGPNVRFAAPDVSVPEARLPTPQVSTPQLSTPKLQAQLARPMTADPDAVQGAKIRMEPYQLQAQNVAAVESIANNMAAAYRQYQVKVNATVVDDAINSAMEARRSVEWGEDDGNGQITGGYKNAKGVDAVRRPSGKALDEEVLADFDKRVQAITKDKLANGEQRRAFKAQVDRMRAQLAEGVSTWTARQFDAYNTSVYKGQLDNLTNEAVSNYDKPPELRDTIDRLDRVSATLAADQGVSAAELESSQRRQRSAAINGAVRQALVDKKFGYAQALLNEWAPKLDQDGVLQLKAQIDGRVSIQLGEDVATSIFRGQVAPAFTPPDQNRAGRVYEITAQAESRNRDRNADGSVVTSPKGAKGRMQVLDGTNKDPGFGVRPARDDSLEERARVGRDYIDAMTARYGGDMKKAWAAYNWGPGNLEAAMKEHGPAWFDHAPAETRAYVTNNLKAYNGGQVGQPPEPKPADLYAEVDRMLPGVENIDARRAAYSWLDKRVSMAKAERAEDQDNAMAQALTIVRQTGGDLNAVPPSVRDRVKPSEWTSVQNYAKNTAEGAYRVTDPAAYYVAMDPVALSAMTPAQIEGLRPKLSETDYNTVRNTWTNLRKPDGPGKGPESLDLTLVDGLVNTRLEYMGIDPKPGAKAKPEEVARIGAIRQFVHRYVLDTQLQQGAKIADYDAMEQLVSRMFTRNQAFRTKFLGMDTGGGSQPVLTSGVRDIPSDTRNRITTSLKSALKREPSEAEVLQAYFRSQFYQTPQAVAAPSPRINWGGEEGKTSAADRSD